MALWERDDREFQEAPRPDPRRQRKQTSWRFSFEIFQTSYLWAWTLGHVGWAFSDSIFAGLGRETASPASCRETTTGLRKRSPDDRVTIALLPS
jgi:hypothetical protein